MKRIIKITTICISCAVLFACGYTFAPQGEYIDKHITTVYVQSFENKTSQAELENYVRKAFIDQFLLSGRFKIAQNVESSDAIVSGSIRNINMSPLSYRANTLMAEERAKMIIEVDFRERESGKTIWSSKNLTGHVDYKMEDNINMYSAIRKNAFIKLANDMAEKALNLMMAGF